MGQEFGVFWGRELYQYPEEKSPIIEGMFYEGDCICIKSQTGIGKSVLALHLLCNLTSGSTFLDTLPVKKKFTVAYLQTEGDRSETINRMMRMKKALDVDDDRWVHINTPGVYINDDSEFNTLVGMLNKSGKRFDVLIIDPIYSTIKGSMLVDEIANKWCRNVRKLREIFGFSVIGFHHDGKESFYYDGSSIKKLEKNAGDVFGSMVWGAFFHSILKFKTHDGLHILEMGKDRGGKGIDRLVMTMQEPTPLYYKVSDAAYGTSKQKVLKYLKDNSSKWVPSKTLVNKLELSKATISRATRELVDNGKVRRKDEHGIALYQFIETIEE